MLITTSFVIIPIQQGSFTDAFCTRSAHNNEASCGCAVVLRPSYRVFSREKEKLRHAVKIPAATFFLWGLKMKTRSAISMLTKVFTRSYMILDPPPPLFWLQKFLLALLCMRLIRPSRGFRLSAIFASL